MSKICGLKGRDWGWHGTNHVERTESRTYSPPLFFAFYPALRTGLLNFGPLGQMRDTILRCVYSSGPGTRRGRRVWMFG